VAAVFDYWAAKRERRQKPLMRPYQMPPPVTDTNPYNVFRPREKISRPQTRRKRENDHAAYQKMAEIRRNMAAGLFILEAVAKRERRKRDLVNVRPPSQPPGCICLCAVSPLRVLGSVQHSSAC
jgi:enhancer of polycomb-like protein